MAIWQEDTVTDSDLQLCHAAPHLRRSLLIFQRAPDGGVVKTLRPPQTHPPTRFTCWPSNQIQPRRGPHLGPASSAPVSSDSPPQSASITG